MSFRGRKVPSLFKNNRTCDCSCCRPLPDLDSDRAIDLQYQAESFRKAYPTDGIVVIAGVGNNLRPGQGSKGLHFDFALTHVDRKEKRICGCSHGSCMAFE